MQKLPLLFYEQKDVYAVAQALLGKLLVTRWGAQPTIARIVETEAYAGVSDRASHAWGGRRTARTEIMYAHGGRSYVYLCYGIHHLFNVVSNVADVPHAVLIRAAGPVQGIDIMLQRTGKNKADYTLTRGPGNLAKAMGISIAHTGLSLLGDEIYIADDGYVIDDALLGISPRIGVEYAGEDAALPYRFFVKGNPYVSGGKVQQHAEHIRKKARTNRSDL
jgi:DNA-3-methyladenine glycosylase